MTSPIEAAMGLWRQNRVVEAEQLLIRELQAAMSEHGRGSAPWAAALSDLGNLLMNSDQLDRAVGCFRNATDATKASDDTRKDHLTYRLNLGIALQLAGRLGPDHQVTLNALSTLANLGDDVGDQTGRIAAIQRVLDSYDRQGRADDAVMAALGLAMAQNDTGDPDAALRTYASAYARADSTGRPELRSQVLRNWGIVLKEVGQPGPAEQRLTEAVAQASKSTDRDALGRAQIALGLFLQHENRLADAQPVIEEGLSVLDPVHPDALIGRSHLSALVDGHTCGCGNLSGTIEDAFRDFALAQLPPGLLADLSVTVEDDDFTVDVHLSRRADRGGTGAPERRAPVHVRRVPPPHLPVPLITTTGGHGQPDHSHQRCCGNSERIESDITMCASPPLNEPLSWRLALRRLAVRLLPLRRGTESTEGQLRGASGWGRMRA